MGIENIFLQLNAIFIARGGLVDGFELALIQQLTGLDRVAGYAFQFDFRQRYAIHTSTDRIQIPDKIFRFLINGRLDL